MSINNCIICGDKIHCVQESAYPCCSKCACQLPVEENILEQMTALRPRLSALEKWGREVTNLLNRGLFIDNTDEIISGNLFDQARTLGLLEGGVDSQHGQCGDCEPQEYAPKGTMARLEALEKWGREQVGYMEYLISLAEFLPAYSEEGPRARAQLEKARTLGLVERE